MGNFDLLKVKGVSRRDFMKLIGATTAALGLPELFVPQAATAMEQALKKPPVIWLEGMDCTGCTESTIATLNPSAAELILDMISIRYHETIMAGSGNKSEEAYQEALKDKFILVVEGSSPSKKEQDHFCMVGGKPFRTTLIEAAKKAQAIIAVGSCASEGGGIPGACATGAVGVSEILKAEGITTPLINLPCCPVKPTTLIGTIVYYLTYQKVPPLDAQNRPLAFYGTLLHDNCPRRGHFENGEFLTDWNDPKQKEYCLILKGCKGPKTYTDCAQVWWNDNANFCINAGSPCSGCSERSFYKEFSPLYSKQENFKLPGIGQVNADTVGTVIGGAAAVGLGVHLIATAASGRLTHKDHKEDL
ncbi:hydrogenase small subunit [Desulfosporosinus metallidurans]|uniref:Uptake hydrogenase small subunit n=1 Tax=Desulfosporosinus metallidurans TaxID=1888891 RepID=A0A1Q8QYC4_9FIRM|nr:hydrogenase small subunit [Desulfosporosinus metallidurans]OLN32305.1 Uptake hydrogenase small subunit precursor [Desulfosporosinus metallidurans]